MSKKAAVSTTKTVNSTAPAQPASQPTAQPTTTTRQPSLLCFVGYKPEHTNQNGEIVPAHWFGSFKSSKGKKFEVSGKSSKQIFAIAHSFKATIADNVTAYFNSKSKQAQNATVTA